VSSQEETRNTEVILVVKGAGTHKADDTLDLFLKGFWPAVTSIDSGATITQRTNIFPKDFCSSPHTKDSHRQSVAEVVAKNADGERRVWVKEPYWEAELEPESPLSVLSNEWHMASYAFGSMLLDWFTGFDSRKRRERVKSRRYFFLAYFAMHFLTAVLPSLFLAFLNLVEAWSLLNDLSGTALASLNRANHLLLIAGLLLVLGLVSLAISTITSAQSASAALRFHKAKTKGERRQLPGMGGWVWLILLAVFFASPGKYLALLLSLGVLEQTILYARHFAWPFRALANSDTDTMRYYTFYDNGRKRFGREHRLSSKLSQLLYRWIVVLGLPSTLIFVALAALLKLIPVTRSVGAFIDNVLNIVLSNVLGDVASYAMNPTQAQRVRSVVAEELKFFHDLCDKDGNPVVSGIHIFAHSQGTPITFETLYRHLPERYRAKIKTYVTIGSVLSFYKQANPALDQIYNSRFPGFPYPDDFHKDFRWVNCWNLYDPITEFFALDEYNMMIDAPHIEELPEKVDLGREEHQDLFKRHRASPHNVRTTGTSLVWQSHFEYWRNLEQVQIPFAKRVLLDDPRPEEWDTRPPPDRERQTSFYARRLLLAWLAVVLPTAVVAVALSSLWNGTLADQSVQLVESLVQRGDTYLAGLEGQKNLLAIARSALAFIATSWKLKGIRSLGGWIGVLLVILFGSSPVIGLLSKRHARRAAATMAK
jgi:hypothetical protein